MTDDNDKLELTPKQPTEAATEAARRERLRTGGWAAAASMGIGSAALVAALMYTSRHKTKDTSDK